MKDLRKPAGSFLIAPHNPSNISFFGIRTVFCLLFLLATAFVASSPISAQVSVTTHHNDIGRTGLNSSETILTTENVGSGQFGKLFAQSVDGYVYAQPLYLSQVSINGASHNVVFVATEHDSVYAFDADSGVDANSSPLWKASLLDAAHGAAAGATAVDSANLLTTDIVPEVGITGTPVIDTSSGTLYVVSKTLEKGQFFTRLHALDITSGAEKFQGPVLITATVSATGNGSSNSSLIFDQEWENQRSGLLLLNGIVYVAFAAHGDNGPWHGWLFGYDARTLHQTGVLNTSPNGVGAGIWMSGAGLAADVTDPVNHPFGRIFLATGNGDYTATTPYANGMDFGDSILQIDLAGGAPTVTDSFTPSDQATLDAEDGDLGSGGVLVLPAQTTGSTPNLLVETGKEGKLFLVNRENMGGYDGTTDHIVQELAGGVPNGVWSMPAYWNGSIYYWGNSDFLRSYSLSNGALTPGATVSSDTTGFPGLTPSISSNGNKEGIVWSIDAASYKSGDEILKAHDAGNLSRLLYSSADNPSRDSPGPAVKFSVPTIANGKVYVGSGNQLNIYGLLTGQPVTATPVFSPASGTVSTTVLSVTLTDATSGATIYYTTDGSAPTTSSARYASPISVSSTETINAIAAAGGYSVSTVATATYTVNLPPPDFTIAASPASLTLAASQSGTTTISVTPQNGFAASVSFNCSGLPAGVGCSFSPASVTPSHGAASTTLTISAAKTAAVHPIAIHPIAVYSIAVHSILGRLFPGAALATVLCCFGLRKRRRAQAWLLLTLAVLSLGILNGCGGGSSHIPTPPLPTTAVITVTAVSGTLQHTTSISLTMQ